MNIMWIICNVRDSINIQSQTSISISIIISISISIADGRTSLN